MYSDSESRSRYLSLAFMSRRAINGLRSIAPGVEVEQDLSASLDRLLAANEQESDANFVNYLRENGDWTRFEDLSAVDEIKNETGTSDLQMIVESVLRGKDVETRRNNIRRLIFFLSALESRALQYYTDARQPRFT